MSPPPPICGPPPRAQVAETLPSPPGDGPPIAAIVGGVAAAVAMAVAGIFFAIYRKKRTSGDHTPAATNPRADALQPAATTHSAAPGDIHTVFMEMWTPPKAPQSTPQPLPASKGSSSSCGSPAAAGAMSSPKLRNAHMARGPDAALDARIRKRNAPLDPEHVGHEVYNMHVTLPDELSMPPLRLLHINAVAHRWEHLPVYEVVPSGDYIEVPYCEAGSDYWDQTCMLSWRWAMGKPSAMSEGATAMSEQQFAELRHKLRAAAEVGLMYVWIDWSCVPQYVGDPMVEIHRSRLYYARARALIVLPGFRALSETPMMVILLTHAQLMLAKSTGEDVASDRLIAQALKRIIDAKACASREYFGAGPSQCCHSGRLCGEQWQFDS
mmetsp:Transcript_6318/g.16329  ORF Transcript_6318/g.16329 Transcript_6318/m.16329 type:complete len:382 (-) Transcript_6318:801-1946(-)